MSVRTILKNITIYGAGGVLGRAIQLILVPLYTRYLTPERYGSLELVYILINIISIIAGMMIASGYIREYYSSEEKDKAPLFSTAFWYTFFTSMIVFAIIFLLPSDTKRWLTGARQGEIIIYLAVLCACIKNLSQLFYNRLMVLKKATLYTVINVVSTAMILLITIYFVAFLKKGVLGVFYALLIGNLLELMICLLFSGSFPVLSFEKRLLKDMLLFSIPLVYIQFFYLVINISDRYFIKHYLSMEELGLYSLSYKIAAVIPLVAIYPLKGFTPDIYERAECSDSYKILLSRFSKFYVAVLLVVLLVLGLFSPEIISFFLSDTYFASWKMVYILAFSYFLAGFNNLILTGINIQKKNRIVGIFWFFAAVLNIILNYLFIPVFKVPGAAFATLISYLLMTVCYLIYSGKFLKIRYEYTRLLMITSFSAALYSFFSTIESGSLTSFITKILLTIFFIFTLFGTGFLKKEEIRRFYLTLRGKR